MLKTTQKQQQQQPSWTKTSPSSLSVYLRQFVRIKLKKGAVDISSQPKSSDYLKGWIFTIDPITLT